MKHEILKNEYIDKAFSKMCWDYDLSDMVKVEDIEINEVKLIKVLVDTCNDSEDSEGVFAHEFILAANNFTLVNVGYRLVTLRAVNVAVEEMNNILVESSQVQTNIEHIIDTVNKNIKDIITPIVTKYAKDFHALQTSCDKCVKPSDTLTLIKTVLREAGAKYDSINMIGMEEGDTVDYEYYNAIYIGYENIQSFDIKLTKTWDSTIDVVLPVLEIIRAHSSKIKEGTQFDITNAIINLNEAIDVWNKKFEVTNLRFQHAFNKEQEAKVEEVDIEQYYTCDETDAKIRNAEVNESNTVSNINARLDFLGKYRAKLESTGMNDEDIANIINDIDTMRNDLLNDGLNDEDIANIINDKLENSSIVKPAIHMVQPKEDIATYRARLVREGVHPDDIELMVNDRIGEVLDIEATAAPKEQNSHE